MAIDIRELRAFLGADVATFGGRDVAIPGPAGDVHHSFKFAEMPAQHVTALRDIAAWAAVTIPSARAVLDASPETIAAKKNEIAILDMQIEQKKKELATLDAAKEAVEVTPKP